jgi:hypothetical protein
MAEAEYQIITLKRAVARHGVVCRMRSAHGRVRVDVFWRPPRVQRNMRPFVSALPLVLMTDLTGNGFAPLNEVPFDGLFKSGLVAASFASEAANAAEQARAVIETHGLANSDRIVAWASPPAERGARAMSRQLADEAVDALAH